ncbi:hypothetical protein D3C87_1724510 [compost metagenome]
MRIVRFVAAVPLVAFPAFVLFSTFALPLAAFKVTLLTIDCVSLIPSTDGESDASTIGTLLARSCGIKSGETRMSPSRLP